MQNGDFIDFSFLQVTTGPAFKELGTASTSTVLPFGELVLAQDQSLAFWLGRCEATDQHILAKANSNSLVKSNSVTRLSLDNSMELILFTIPSAKDCVIPASTRLGTAIFSS